jgi:hypothetical protein
MEQLRTIVLVLRSGGDFALRDVELIARHIQGKWRSSDRPRILCLWDKASQHYDLGNFELLPLPATAPGTWSRIHLYSPEMEQYKPFLYVDLDTAVIQSLERVFDLVKKPERFITLEDFWQKGALATGLVWFPKDCEKTKKVWEAFKVPTGRRMDTFIRQITQPDLFWQHLTDTILDFKPRAGKVLREVPPFANLICFHGKPRIFEAGESSLSLDWVRGYIAQTFTDELPAEEKVAVIIPYKEDRGWLKDAIASVPKGVQLILSQGDGNWPENFNAALHKVDRPYVRWLHEDDMLTPNSIEDAVKAIEEQGVDFIHGNAMEIHEISGFQKLYRPLIQFPTAEHLLKHNVLHSATMLYRTDVFNRVGKMSEVLNTAEEFEFNLRCLSAGLKLGYCNSTLAYYRRHAAQKVRVVSKVDKDREREQVRSTYR